jgi:HAD superfamily hydrolase (TIGR01490 family)
VEITADGSEVAAFFDFDGTLIDGFSAKAYLRDRLLKGEIGPAELGRTLLVGLRGVGSPSEFVELVEMTLASWAGRSEDELDELGERLFAQDIAPHVFPEAFRLVRKHIQDGHTVVIASSATRFQVAPLARALGVEHVITTPVGVENGVLTGKVDGFVPYAEGKAEAIRRFADERGIDLAASYAYSNGAEDVPFLEAVGQPRAINPEDGLRRVANERGWPTFQFDKREGVTVGQLVRTAGAWAGFLGGFGVGAVAGALTGSRRRSIDLGMSLAGDLGLAAGGIDVEVQGRENLWSARPAVFMLNHQSSLVDVMVIFNVLRGEISGVAKKEAKGMPVVGQMLQFADTAFVDRGNSAAAREALKPALDRLNSGISLVIAPEGTRSYTPALGPFKKGGFHLAMQAGVPIVPVVIRNAGERMWRNNKTLNPGSVQVAVLPPVRTDNWTVEDLSSRVNEVRQMFVDILDDWPRKETR